MAKALLFVPPNVPRSSITPPEKRKGVRRFVEQPRRRKLGGPGHLPAVVDGPGEAAVAAEGSEVRQLLRFRGIDHRMVLPEPKGPARQCDESGNQAAVAHRQRSAPEPAGGRHRPRGAIDHEPSGASIGTRRAGTCGERTSGRFLRFIDREGAGSSSQTSGTGARRLHKATGNPSGVTKMFAPLA